MCPAISQVNAEHTKSTASNNTNPITLFQLRSSSSREGIPYGDTSAENRSNFGHVAGAVGDMHRRRGIKDSVFGEKTVLREPTEIFRLAELGSKLCAIGTRKAHIGAGISTHTITLLEPKLLLRFLAGFDDNSTGFVSRNEV